jgi:hypothetical protein
MIDFSVNQSINVACDRVMISTAILVYSQFTLAVIPEKQWLWCPSISRPSPTRNIEDILAQGFISNQVQGFVSK